MLTKCLLEGRESGLASAVAGCHVLHLKRIVEDRNDLLDVWIARHYEVKPARDQMDARVDRAGRFNNLVNAWMRAPNHKHDAIRRVDSQRPLAQFQCAR